MQHPSSLRSLIYHERRNSAPCPIPNFSSVSLFYLWVGFFWRYGGCQAVHNGIGLGKGQVKWKKGQVKWKEK